MSSYNLHWPFLNRELYCSMTVKSHCIYLLLCVLMGLTDYSWQWNASWNTVCNCVILTLVLLLLLFYLWIICVCSVYFSENRHVLFSHTFYIDATIFTITVTTMKQFLNYIMGEICPSNSNMCNSLLYGYKRALQNI